MSHTEAKLTTKILGADETTVFTNISALCVLLYRISEFKIMSVIL